MPPATSDRSPREYRIEALAKGLRVLRLFDESTKHLRVVDICQRTGFPMPTAFRIVSTLEAEGFLRKRQDGAFEPSLAVLTLGTAALRGSDLVQAATGPLESLARETGETVNLGQLTGTRVLYLQRFRNDDLVTANIQVGSTLPAIYTSMGKVMLAALTEEQLADLLPPSEFAQPVGPNAVTSHDALREQLSAIRAQGFALQNEELASGLRSVSVPIASRRLDSLAAINVAVAAHRRSADDLVGPLLQAVQRTAEEITSRLEER